MAELSGQLVDLVDVLGADGRRLAEQLRETPSWPRRVRAAGRVLAAAAGAGAAALAGGRPGVGAAGRLRWSGPDRPARRGVGWSHKHLIAKFRQQVGLRPKTAARLVRLDEVWRRLDQARGRLDWGQVAREGGYADQAHLIRDFHQFTGTTPTEFVARTTPPGGDGERQVNFVQDAVAAASWPGR
jgi:AraC-like DNA-binding protein